MGSLRLGCLVTAVFCLFLSTAGPASAAGLGDTVDQWMPSSDGASWLYEWSDSAYAPQPTRERYTFGSRAGNLFRLGWTSKDDDLGNGDGAVRTEGIMDFQRTDAGLVNTNWNSDPPPPEFPILCAQAANCGNSLAGTLYMLIWGTRSPVLAEPLVQGTRWSSTGAAGNDVSSTNRYLGIERVFPAAFPAGVLTAKVESDITQAGALGDPYGSAVRTVWWARGVGPVRIVMEHPGGELTRSELISTNLSPLPMPPDANYLPLNRDGRMVYRWRNSEYMKKYATQQFDVGQVVNNTARVDVKQLSGPIAVTGSYVFATRLGGITNLQATTKAASKAKFPPLGPRSQPRSNRRRFFTPFDLMTFGFGPVLPAYPEPGQTWQSSPTSRDFSAYGVSGTSKVVGFRTVRTPAGRFRAIVVESRLRQKGFAFGSGTRTSWFAPGKGLVKLVFRHGDHSVSTVERLR